jgi:hypothetical protein
MSTNPDKPAFEVRNVDTGQIFRIWASGKTEGFGDDVRVKNRIPLLINSAVILATNEVSNAASASAESVANG